MPDTPQLSAETVAKLAAESVPIKLSEAQRKAAADMVAGLSVEMEPMRRFAVGEAEPALIYQANTT
jgi:hypothetical protein